MKNTIKSILALLLTVVMLFAVAGCGEKKPADTDTNANDDFFGIDENTITGEDSGSGTTDNSASSGQSQNTNKTGGKSWKDVLASMPKELRGSTITFYNWNPTSEYQGASSVIEKFEKQTGITVKWKTVNFDQYQTMLSAAIASGESPDVVRMRTTNPVPLQNLQPISSSGFDFSDEAWDKRVMDDYTYNGKAYCTSIKNTPFGTVDFLMYNSALIDQYDLEDPYQLWKGGKWTWNKFIEISKNFKKSAKAKYAIATYNWGTWFNIHGITAPVELQNGKFVNISCTKEFVNVAQKISDLVNTEELMSSEVVSGFDKGEVLFFGDCSIFARSKNAYNGSLKEAGTLCAVPFPTIEGQSKYYVGSGEYEAYGIAKGAKNAKAVPYLLRYFLDAENYDSKSFYTNAQTLEVYNWCMNQEIIASIGFNASQDTAETYDQNWYTKFVKTSSSQMKSYLESYSHIVDARATELNRALDALK